jgi:type II restriction enzyme
VNQSNQLLRLADGRKFLVTQENYSALQVAIIENYGPRFAPGAIVLYISDIPDGSAIHEKGRLEKLGIIATTFEELPDFVLYLAPKDRLYFIEAGIAHRAITHKRRKVLEQISKNCKAARIYVSAFPDFSRYRKHAANIAWYSCVWLATNPDHTIYYDGEHSVAVHG